jgi:hypothetical protein
MARKEKVMSRRITETERTLGRSENYDSMSGQDQWDEDKRLGILDWDDSKSEAQKIPESRKAIPVNGSLNVIKSVYYVHICNTLVFRTTFKDSGGYERDMIVTGIESIKIAKAMAKHMGWTGEVRVLE